MKMKLIVPVVGALMLVSGCSDTVTGQPTAVAPAPPARNFDPYALVKQETWAAFSTPRWLLDWNRDRLLKMTAGQLADKLLEQLESPEAQESLGLNDAWLARIRNTGIRWTFAYCLQTRLDDTYQAATNDLTLRVLSATRRLDRLIGEWGVDAHNPEMPESWLASVVLDQDLRRAELMSSTRAAGWRLAAGQPGVTRSTPAAVPEEFPDYQYIQGATRPLPDWSKGENAGDGKPRIDKEVCDG